MTLRMEMKMRMRTLSMRMKPLSLMKKTTKMTLQKKVRKPS